MTEKELAELFTTKINTASPAGSPIQPTAAQFNWLPIIDPQTLAAAVLYVSPTSEEIELTTRDDADAETTLAITYAAPLPGDPTERQAAISAAAVKMQTLKQWIINNNGAITNGSGHRAQLTELKTAKPFDWQAAHEKTIFLATVLLVFAVDYLAD